MPLEGMVQLNETTFASYVQARYHQASEGPLTDFLSRRGGNLYLGDALNLNELVARYGAPLEVVYYPQITKQIRQMQAWAQEAREATGYRGKFLYTYATKANFAAEVVQTALAAGAHYETSAANDVEIAHYLWEEGLLPQARLILCNGSKEPHYLAAILNLRLAGHPNVLSILDDLEELEELRNCPLPLAFGVRERAAGNRAGNHLGNNRFGLTGAEIEDVVKQLEGSPHRLILYHAMVGTQIEDSDHFLALLHDSMIAYCQLRRKVPSLRYFDFGGGMPTSGYKLDFKFDYAAFMHRLMAQMRLVCQDYNVPMPDLIGEFGRYTVANHSLFLFEVGHVKAGQQDAPAWYLLNGSLMVSFPDMLLVEDQEFVVLPLDDWDAPVTPVRLAGRRTCDSDDLYPRPHQEPLLLPATGKGLTVAVCGAGAYQQMIAGRGGAHHCLNPEPRRVEAREVKGQLILRSQAPQSKAAIMQQLGYAPSRVAIPLPQVAHRKAS